MRFNEAKTLASGLMRVARENAAKWLPIAANGNWRDVADAILHRVAVLGAMLTDTDDHCQQTWDLLLWKGDYRQ